MKVKCNRRTPQELNAEKEALKTLTKLLDVTFTDPNYRHSGLYYLLRDKLTEYGFWKAKARGNPIKGWRKYQETKNRQAEG